MRAEFEKLQKAVGDYDQSKKDLERAMRECFPIGRLVSYRQGQHTVHVQVLEHGEGDRAKVRNPHTGGRYWISMWRFFKRDPQ